MSHVHELKFGNSVIVIKNHDSNMSENHYDFEKETD